MVYGTTPDFNATVVRVGFILEQKDCIVTHTTVEVLKGYFNIISNIIKCSFVLWHNIFQTQKIFFRVANKF